MSAGRTLDSILLEEAYFADQAYAPWANQLDINPRMFEKYAHPVHDWDWRQMGARLLGPVAGADLLDFGCGMGEESAYFARLGARVTAMDISPKGIEIARNRAFHNGLEIRAFVAQALNNGLPSESFDIVHGCGILHHIGLSEGLAETRRLLRPGGRAIFTEHMGNSPLIEKLKVMLKRSDYTDNEQPVRWQDCLREAALFSESRLIPYHILSRLSKSPGLKKLDHRMLQAVPALRHFAGGVLFWLRK